MKGLLRNYATPNFGLFYQMSNIPYSRICVIYMLCPCALGLALRNVRNIFILQMALVVVTIITLLKLRWISVTDQIDSLVCYH